MELVGPLALLFWMAVSYSPNSLIERPVVSNNLALSKTPQNKPSLRQQSSPGVKNIPGTSLFSETYYQLKKKTPHGSTIGYFYGYSEPEGANYLQVDPDPNRAKFYEEGGKWEAEGRFKFIEALDHPGWYEIRNKDKPKAIVTSSLPKFESGYRIGLSGKAEDAPRLASGGDLRDYALWKIVDVGNGFFQLKNKQFPQGFVTHTDYAISFKYFYLKVDIDPSHAKEFEDGGNRYADTLFSALDTSIPVTPTPPTVKKLQAKIHSLKFVNVTSDLISAHKKSFVELVPPSPSQDTRKTFKKPFQFTSNATFSFLGNFKLFNNVTLNVELPEIASGSVQTGVEMQLSPQNTVTLSRIRTSEATLDYVSSLGGSQGLLFRTEWIDKLPVTFEATMEITGTSEFGNPVSGDIVKYNLPSEWKSAEVLSVTANSLNVKVEGQYVGTFGHIWYFSSENL